MKPRLKDVTLCTADSVHPALAARALEKSLEHCDFADAILFSDTAIAGRFRHVAINRMNSRADYSRFMIKDLGSHIETAFALVIQWDGYVTDGSAWSNRFRRHDYIGALWTWYRDPIRVGNGGFSLRSRRLLAATRGLPLLPNINEDIQICRAYRVVLEREHGIRFAPEDVAVRFSFERDPPPAPTFGFHGLFNMWRFMDDAELFSIVGELSRDEIIGWQFVLLIKNCLDNGRFDAVRRFYPMIKRYRSAEQVAALLLRGHTKEVAARTMIRLEAEFSG